MRPDLGRPLRILYVNWVKGESGAAVHVRETTRELSQLGCEIEILWHYGLPESVGAAPRAYSRRSRILAWLLHEPKEILESLSGLVREARYVRRFRPDLILYRYAPGKWSPVIWAKILRQMVVLEVNALYGSENLKYANEYLHYTSLLEGIERVLLSSSHAVTVVSEAMRDVVCSKLHMPQEAVLVNPNGANIQNPLSAADQAALRSRIGGRERPIIVFSGSFQSFHGAGLLASSMVRLLGDGFPANFIILGRGAGWEELHKIREKFPDQVFLPGQVSHKEAVNILSICDVGVMPEHTSYGSPLKLLEYMAAGLAIVAPDYPPVRELIQDGVSGLVFRPQDEEQLVNRLREIVLNVELRQSLGKAASARVARDLSWQKNAERLMRFVMMRMQGDTRCIA